jgi:hypothetical protein
MGLQGSRRHHASQICHRRRQPRSLLPPEPTTPESRLPVSLASWLVPCSCPVTWRRFPPQSRRCTCRPDKPDKTRHDPVSIFLPHRCTAAPHATLPLHLSLSGARCSVAATSPGRPLPTLQPPANLQFSLPSPLQHALHALPASVDRLLSQRHLRLHFPRGQKQQSVASLGDCRTRAHPARTALDQPIDFHFY